MSCCAMALVLLLSYGITAEAQWASQHLTLKPGWNAVFLEIEPQPGTCESVFEGTPIDSVWYWSPDTSTVQFITSPDKLVPENPDWRAYFPANSLASTLTTLRVMRGNRPYLIKLGGTSDVAWTVRGMPSVRPLKWIPDSYNLTGFPVDSVNAPTFDSLFAASTSHAGQAVWRLSALGQWEQTAGLAVAKPNRGEAFWVYTAGVSEYQGPIHVTLDLSSGLNFGRGLTELIVRITNESAAEKTYTLTPRISESPGDPASPALAGAVPLAYWKEDYAGLDVAWHPLTPSASFTVAAGNYRPIKLAVQRNKMAPFTGASAGDALYQSILEISDGQGSVLGIPVTARGFQGNSIAKQAVHPLAGLWIGTATLKAVSAPAGINPTTPEPTGSEFSFQLIVHVDAAGMPRLLQHVTQMWKKEIYAPDPANPENQVVVEPGRYVLITDDSRLAGFSGVGERGGVPVGRRFSCPAFGFREPIEMTGTFPTPSQPAGNIGCTVALDYNDPLNPFKHRHHPDHDNLDARYEQGLEEGKESFTVTRAVALEFVDYSVPPEGEGEGENLLLSAYAGWGDSWIGGTYTETITGIHREALHVKGTFQLNFVSDVAELNPEK